MPGRLSRDPAAIRSRLAALPHVAVAVAAAERASIDLASMYLVGGVVRDLLLDRGNFDIDLAVEGNAITAGRALATDLDGRCIVYEAFGTAAVIASLGPTDTIRLDVVTARSESYVTPGALPDVVPSTIEDDLARRDFTINAMAIALGGERAWQVIDPTGGVADLAHGRIRILHDDSFIDDPTRLFRAVRYAARYGFDIDGRTLELARTALAGAALETVSAQRIRAEIELMFEEPSFRSVAIAGAMGLLEAMHPKLLSDAQTVEMVRRIDDAEHGDIEDVLAWRMRLAVIARELDDEDLTVLARGLALRARDARVIRESVRALRAICGTAGDLEDVSATAVLETIGSPGSESLSLARMFVDCTSRLARRIDEIAARAANPRPVTTGHDLLALGLPRGPLVGEVLRELQEQRLAGMVTDDASEREAASQLVEERLSSAASDGDATMDAATGGPGMTGAPREG